jgi:hypothetical protein
VGQDHRPPDARGLPEQQLRIDPGRFRTRLDEALGAFAQERLRGLDRKPPE